jgi:hypothetical protein
MLSQWDSTPLIKMFKENPNTNFCSVCVSPSLLGYETIYLGIHFKKKALFSFGWGCLVQLNVESPWNQTHLHDRKNSVFLSILSIYIGSSRKAVDSLTLPSPPTPALGLVGFSGCGLCSFWSEKVFWPLLFLKIFRQGLSKLFFSFG